MNFSRDEQERYARHFVLPEFGRRGQERLKKGSVLVVGAGGLGSPALQYLAAAGVGTIGIVDNDAVDVSNLQRQVIHRTDRIGWKKTRSSAETLSGINPLINVVLHETYLTSANALDVLRQYDVVIDGTDNFPTRYLLNDASVFLKKPLVYGSVFRFEGQVSVFSPGVGPCYRCLYPEPPPDGMSQNCAEAGVLGILPGLIGTMQAAEAIKLIAGIGRPLIGTLLIIDTLSTEVHHLKIAHSAACPVCGDQPTITELIDYEAFCHPGRPDRKDTTMKEISVEELKKRIDAKEQFVLLDVRRAEEHQFANIGGTLIPMHELEERLGELDPTKETIVYCRSGVRSASVVHFLEKKGFADVKNVRGGILAWSRSIDPSVPTY